MNIAPKGNNVVYLNIPNFTSQKLLMNTLSEDNSFGKAALAVGTAMVASQLPVIGNTSSISGTVKLPVGFQFCDN